MAYQLGLAIPIPTTISAPSPGLAVEARTLLTFPTEGLPSPCVVSQANLRAFPVRYPTGSAPAQTQINRWLCCRCAEEGYTDPVGMIHYVSSARASSFSNNDANNDPLASNPTRSAPRYHDEAFSFGGSGVCWRATCRHRKCVNCVLYAGPLGRDGPAKLLIRTVGGLHASPRFVDPVHWECAGCGEWARNRFDSRCALGVTPCVNRACVFGWRAGQAQLLGLAAAGAQGGGVGGGGGVGAGVLTADSVVMNRYGQRLGTADQRVALAEGPWDWQRRALGDPRCAVVAGLRTAMRRAGEGMRSGSNASGSRRSLGVLATLWKDGEPVPHYPYRRPPPVHENDVEENNEYEGSYLAGMPTEPLDKGKGLEQHYAARSHSPSFYPTLSPMAANSGPGVGQPVAYGSPPGWSPLADVARNNRG